MLALNQIHHGDCLDLMQDIADSSVDMVLCDLPYGATENKWDSPIDLVKLWRHYKRIVKKGGVIALTAQSPFDKILGVSNLPMLRYEWIWHKTAATGHLNARRAPMKAHENVLIFYDSLPTYNPIRTTNHRRVTASAAASNACRYSENYGEQKGRVSDYDSTERFPRSVITFPSDKQKSALHPTQKPVALFEYLIRTYTNEGEVVLDNCAGSFTTAVAAENTGRQWVCIEQEAKYVEVGNARLADLRRQPSLFAF